MGFRFPIRLLFTVILFSNVGCAFAQINGTTVWKKRVTRTVWLTKGNEIADSSLLIDIIHAVLSNKAKAYLSFDYLLPDFRLRSTYYKTHDNSLYSKGEFTKAEFKEQVYGDSASPVFKKDVHGYQFLENWSFNFTTGKTEIEIIAIAPYLDIFDQTDKRYRGSQAMFWVLYKDVKEILLTHAKTQKSHELTRALWGDYFACGYKFNLDKMPGADYTAMENTTNKRRVIRSINVEPEDTNIYRLKISDSPLDSPLALILSEEIISKKTLPHKVSNDLKNLKAMPSDSFEVMINWLGDISCDHCDTVIVAIEAQKNLALQTRFYLLEEWIFLPETGKTKVDIIAIAPFVCYYYKHEPPEYLEIPLFWVKYSDAVNTISRYEQYHPENTIALQIWTQYLYTKKIER